MCQPGERRYRKISPSVEERDVADERDSFKPALLIAVPVEGTAIHWANQAVVIYPTRFDERVERTSGKETQHFGCVLVIELLK